MSKLIVKPLTKGDGLCYYTKQASYTKIAEDERFRSTEGEKLSGGYGWEL